MRHGAAIFEPVDNEGCPKVVIENDGKYTTLIVDGINLCQGCKSIEFKHTAGESATLTVGWETDEICFCSKKKASDAAMSEKIADPVVQVQSQCGMDITFPFNCMTEAVRTATGDIKQAQEIRQTLDGEAIVRAIREVPDKKDYMNGGRGGVPND